MHRSVLVYEKKIGQLAEMLFRLHNQVRAIFRAARTPTKVLLVIMALYLRASSSALWRLPFFPAPFT